MAEAFFPLFVLLSIIMACVFWNCTELIKERRQTKAELRALLIEYCQQAATTKHDMDIFARKNDLLQRDYMYDYTFQD